MTKEQFMVTYIITRAGTRNAHTVFDQSVSWALEANDEWEKMQRILSSDLLKQS